MPITHNSKNRDSSGLLERRYSMAFFVNVNGDTTIEALTLGNNGTNARYPPISAREHLMAKHLASMGVFDANHDEL